MLEIKVSNVKSHISGESSKDFEVMKELEQFFSVKINGAKFSKAYQNKVWDGYKYFYTTKSRLILTGLLPEVIKYLSNRKGGEYPYQLIDFRVNLPTISPIISENLGHFTLRPYQLEAVSKSNNFIAEDFYFPRGIISGATNAGKSVIFSSILAHIEDVRALLFIHNKTIFDQLYEDLSRLFGKVGIVNANQCTFEDITVCMEQTVLNKIKNNNSFVVDNMQSYNTIIVDECHRAGGDSYQKVLSNIDAGARFFFSGTALENEDVVKNISIMGQSGKVLHTISNNDLIDLGVSRKPVVRMYLNPTHIVKYQSYEEEQQAVVEQSEERLELMMGLIAERLDRYILISCTKIDHGLKIYKAIQRQFPQVRSAFIHGKSTDRQYRLEDFKKGNLEILISSMIIKEGANIPIIDTLIYAPGGKSVIASKQIIGRALRAKDGHDQVEIIDFYDKGRWVEEHSIKRLETYAREKFEIVKYF